MESTLCIPRIDINTSKQYIFTTMCKLRWGHISILNEIPLRNDQTQKRVIIRVKWNATVDTETKDRLNDGDTLKLVHDINSPWFWRIMRVRDRES